VLGLGGAEVAASVAELPTLTHRCIVAMLCVRCA
jgi:hypothetical protein